MAKSNTIESILLSLADKQQRQYEDLDKRLDNIEKVMIGHDISLKEHMKRSDHLEEIVEIIKDTELKPLQKHVSMVEGIVKFVGILSLIVGILTGIASLFGLI